MRTFAIWSEGYRATGEHGDATLHGYAKGETFEEACRNLAAKDKDFAQSFRERQDCGRWYGSFWGCRLFDNEEDARKVFG